MRQREDENEGFWLVVSTLQGRYLREFSTDLDEKTILTKLVSLRAK